LYYFPAGEAEAHVNGVKTVWLNKRIAHKVPP